MWNTYQTDALNTLLHLPDLAGVQVGLYDTVQKFYLPRMLWRNPESDAALYENIDYFGDHAEDGSYWRIGFRYRDFRFAMEVASGPETFLCRLAPSSGEPGRYRFVITGSVRAGRMGSVDTRRDEIVIRTGAGTHRIRVLGRVDADTYINNADAAGIAVCADEPVCLLCNREEPADPVRELADARERYLRSRPDSGGYLAHMSDAIQKAMIWNTIYEPVGDRLCAPVSRAWCMRNGVSFGSYVLFEWDTFLTAMMSGVFSRGFALSQLAAILMEMTPEGMIPNFGSQRGGSPDRSQPPVGSYCVLKLYRQLGETEILERHFDALLRWNRWWPQHRDGNGDGLLEWGSDPIPRGTERGYFDNGNTHLCAMYESGLDNSPMYDDVPFNDATHTLELADVGLCALYALDCRCLAEMAEILGREDDAALLRGEYAGMAERMNTRMYDQASGMYCNLHWNGEKDHRYSPTNFYPLLAGIPDGDQAERMVREHLMNPREFWGDYVLPSISREHPAYADQDYWRGRIWAPMNYLVYEGLKGYGLEESAFALADKSRSLLLGEWLGESHIHENYNADTGDGDDKRNADPFYTWGALLALLPFSELLYVRPEGGVRIGSGLASGGSVTGYPLWGDRYNLSTEGTFRLDRNGETLLSSTDSNAVVDHFMLRDGTLSLTLVSSAATLLIEPSDGIDRVTVAGPGKATFYDGPLEGPINITPPEGNANEQG